MAIHRTLYRILDSAKNRIEYASTLTIEYTTQAYDEESGWLDIEPDTIEAWLETAETSPQKIKQLPCEKVGDRTRVWINFFADPNVVQSGKAYYVTLYWTKEGIKEVQRVLVVVVPDVK